MTAKEATCEVVLNVYEILALFYFYKRWYFLEDKHTIYSLSVWI